MALLGSLLTRAAEFLVAVLHNMIVFSQFSPRDLAKPLLSLPRPEKRTRIHYYSTLPLTHHLCGGGDGGVAWLL